jgi:hypothetical protein
MMGDLEKPHTHAHAHAHTGSVNMNFPLTTSASTPFTQSAYIPSIPEPPAITGGYLDPSYHTFSTCKPIKILQCLQTALTSLKIDYNVKPQKYKLKCVTYRNGCRIPFITRVFSTTNSCYAGDAAANTNYSIVTSDVTKPVLKSSTCERYAIEIQRRSGCIISFSEIYRSILHHLEDNGIIVCGSGNGNGDIMDADTIAAQWTGSAGVKRARSNFSLACPPLNMDTHDNNDASSPISCCIKEAKATLACLVQMSSSPCADVKAQAIAALSEMSRNANDEVLEMLVASGGLCTLIQAVEHSFEDVHRNALSGIANLTLNNMEACQRVKAVGLKSLYGLSHSKTAQVIRECARALANIGLTLGNDVIDHEFRGALDKFCCSPDVVTREHAHRLAERISIQ